MVDTNNSNTVELTQDDLNEVNREFSMLAAALGTPLSADFVYTPEAGAQLKIILDAALRDAQIVLDTGIVDGSIINLGPLPPVTNKDILADIISKGSGGAIDTGTVLGFIDDAEQNISILDQVSVQLASATNSSTVSAEAKPVPVDSSIQSDPRIARIETALTQIVPILNGLENMGSLTLRPTTEIPVPGTVDGYLDQASLDSYQQTMQQLNYLVAVNDVNVVSQASMIAGTTSLPLDQKIAHFVPANAEGIEELLVESITKSITEKGVELSTLKGSGTATAAQISALNAEIIELNTLKTQTIPQVLQDMAALHASNSLSVAVNMRMSEPETVIVQTSTNPTGVATPVTPVVSNSAGSGTSLADADADVDTSVADILSGNATAQNANEVDTSIKIVEETLFELGGQLDKMVGQFGGIAQSLAGSLVTPLTQADLDDRDPDGNRVLGENSQDLTSKLVMMLKTLNGEKNPNGVYTESIGRQLQIAILTKDDFSMIREQLGIDKVTPAEAQALIARPPTEVPPLAEGADAAQQAAHTAATATYNQQKVEYEASAAKTDKLNVLFHSLDVLRQNGVLDEERARSTTKMNMIMDGLAGALDKFAPGFKDALKDFFTNSDFGKMIGGMLTMFGININRLWGDKDDSAALKNAAGLVGDGFETSFDKIAADNNLDPKLDFDKIMDLTKDSFQDQMDGFLPRNAMKLMLGNADAEQINAALADAMNRASSATDMEGAKQIFVDRLVQIGEAYKNGTSITLLTHVETIGQTIEDVVAERPELAASTSVSASTTSTVQSSVSAAAYVASEPAVDLPVVTAGETHVELAYDPSTEDFEQDPERFSKGRVATIQEVLHSNAALLGISAVNPDFMYLDKEANEFTDTMTRETCGVFEEVWIRANIHAMVEAETEITQEGLDEIAQTRLSSENMGVILTYMHDKDVPQADIDAFSQNMLALDKDFASSADGSTQTVSVFDQALLWGQLTPNVAQWVPEQAPVVIIPNGDDDVTAGADNDTTDADNDPLRDRYMEYNKDNLPCDIPLFYTKEGSDSVFALVRIKTDGPLDNDPSNDTFKVLELNDYLNTKSLDDPEQLAVFLDNYNWRNPTKEGVENVINKILCLEPRAQADNTNTQESNNTDDAVVTRTFNTQAYVHQTPESFRDLRLLDQGKAAFLFEGLDIANDRPDLMARAARNHDDPLNTFFGDALGMRDGTTPFVFLELAAHGLHHDDFDVVVAMRNGSTTEYRFVDYDTDFIKPLSEQRVGGATDMAENVAPAQGGRRMDDLLRVIERIPGGHVVHGAAGGYAQMSAIIPNGPDSLGLTNGLKAVYGADMTTHKNQIAYSEGISSRYAESSRYEHTGPRDNAQSDRQAEFNDRSGAQRGNWFTRIFTGGKSRDEESANDDINDNIKDIGDGQNYDPAALDAAVPEQEMTRQAAINGQ
ncbi:MAG: hypothetical protein COB36_08270 [Alphaproteobacteria bacterium]|nr:MAG: hypothetical protein COB36_08270 [Alphaproteobacteria bacterium]